jgi:hypothetical protein
MVSDLLELGYMKKVRVCFNCVNRIGNINGVERARSLGEKERERKSTLFNHSSSLLRPESSILAFNK